MKTRPTLIFIRAHTIGTRQFRHAEELPPNVLTAEQIDQWLDSGQLREYEPTKRRSLYRLFAPFSGASEREQLTQQEREALCII